jgi:lactate dehydrogenase-like 2-hydroxyacid dehydrogenase
MMRGQPDRLGLRDLNPGYFEEFEVGGCKIHRASPDDQVALVGAGVTLHECLAAAAELAGAGISVRVLDLYSVKPLDAGALIEACHVTGSRLVIAEDHYPEGGIGAAVLETLAAAGVPSLQIAHLAVTGLPGSGTPAELLDAAGISARHIAAAARRPAEDDLGAIVATRGAGLTPAGQPAQGKAPRLLADTQARRREHYPVAELAAHTLLVVGLGSVGREVARLATAFGMHVIAINRTGRAETPGLVEEIRPPRFLADLLPVAHAVVISLPLTEQTRALIDAAAISRMRTGAVLVNLGHGAVVDEQALIQALQNGLLAGAALDVFATEPPPADSPLWRLPNVLISPHTAGLSVHENERIVTLFTENLRRYLRGDKMLSPVRPAQL